MKEKTLLKIALSCVFLGLITLFFIAENSSLANKNIEEISEDDVGKTIKITGVLTKVSDKDKVMFIEVGQQRTEKISVVLFKDHDFELIPGQYVSVIGQVEEYQGKKELIANKLTLE